MNRRRHTTTAAKAAATTLAPLSIEQVEPTLLVPAPWNPRKISATARRHLRNGLERFGLLQPFIARREDHMMIGGHQRLDICVEMGHTTVPVVFVDGLSDSQAKALAVLLNNEDAQGEWNPASLSTLLAELRDDPLEDLLGATGFDEKTLDKLLEPLSVDAETSLTPREIEPIGPMVWVLIGMPSEHFGRIADTVQSIAAMSQTHVCEVVHSNLGADEHGR